MADHELTPSSAEPRRLSSGRKIGLAAALAVLPLGAWTLYRTLEQTGRESNRDMEKGFAYEPAGAREVDPAVITHRQISQIDTGLRMPTAIAIDFAGNLLVGGEKTLRRIALRGPRLPDIPLDADPQALASGKDGRIFVAYLDREIGRAHV